MLHTFRSQSIRAKETASSIIAFLCSVKHSATARPLFERSVNKTIVKTILVKNKRKKSEGLFLVRFFRAFNSLFGSNSASASLARTSRLQQYPFFLSLFLSLLQLPPIFPLKEIDNHQMSFCSYPGNMHIDIRKKEEKEVVGFRPASFGNLLLLLPPPLLLHPVVLV